MCVCMRIAVAIVKINSLEYILTNFDDILSKLLSWLYFGIKYLACMTYLVFSLWSLYYYDDFFQYFIPTVIFIITDFSVHTFQKKIEIWIEMGQKFFILLRSIYKVSSKKSYGNFPLHQNIKIDAYFTKCVFMNRQQLHLWCFNLQILTVILDIH